MDSKTYHFPSISRKMILSSHCRVRVSKLVDGFRRFDGKNLDILLLSILFSWTFWTLGSHWSKSFDCSKAWFLLQLINWSKTRLILLMITWYLLSEWKIGNLLDFSSIFFSTNIYFQRKHRNLYIPKLYIFFVRIQGPWLSQFEQFHLLGFSLRIDTNDVHLDLKNQFETVARWFYCDWCPLSNWSILESF